MARLWQRQSGRWELSAGFARFASLSRGGGHWQAVAGCRLGGIDHPVRGAELAAQSLRPRVFFCTASNKQAIPRDLLRNKWRWLRTWSCSRWDNLRGNRVKCLRSEQLRRRNPGRTLRTVVGRGIMVFYQNQRRNPDQSLEGPSSSTFVPADRVRARLKYCHISTHDTVTIDAQPNLKSVAISNGTLLKKEKGLPPMAPWHCPEMSEVLRVDLFGATEELVKRETEIRSRSKRLLALNASVHAARPATQSRRHHSASSARSKAAASRSSSSALRVRLERISSF
jgi:hypothetical protein